MGELADQMNSLPVWVWILLGTIAGGFIRDLFSIRKRRAETTKTMVDAQSEVIKELSFAYELIARRPEIRQWLQEAQQQRTLDNITDGGR